MLKRAIMIMIAILLLAGIASSFSVSKAEATTPSLGPWVLLRTLNDSIGYLQYPDECTDYVSSPPPGTFNGRMVWYNVSIPLSAYRGKVVYIAFMFNTLDGIENKFQGWFIRNVRAGTIPSFNLSSMSFAWRKCGSGNGPTWHLDSGVWHYANPTTGNYQGNPVYDECDDTWNWGSVVTTPFMVTRGSALNFSTEWQIEAASPHYFDQMKVYIAVNDFRSIPPCPTPNSVGAFGDIVGSRQR